MEMKNKVAIVTGASSGIGLATAEILAERGAKVAVVARSMDKLQELARKLPNSLPVKADMTKEADIISMVRQVEKHFGGIDILVNSAGQGYDASVEKIDIATFKRLFDLNVVGPLVAMQQVIPIMRRKGKGVIVNISSGTALMYLPNMSPYSSLKRALVGLSLTAREELREGGISVGVVYPYITLTDFEKNTIKAIEEADVDSDEEEGAFQPPDTPEYIAAKIVEGIESEEAEIYAHDWMKRL